MLGDYVLEKRKNLRPSATQAALAKALRPRRSQRWWSDVENNHSIPDETDLAQIASLVNGDMEHMRFLAGYRPDPPSGRPLDLASDDGGRGTLVSIYESLTIPGRAALLETARALQAMEQGLTEPSRKAPSEPATPASPKST